jgi:AraC-like DNA-binding protein
MAFRERRTYRGTPLSCFIGRKMVFRAHWHDEIEIVLGLEGSTVVGVGGTERALGRGELAVAFPGDIHYYASTDESSRALLLIYQRPGLRQRGALGELSRFIPKGEDRSAAETLMHSILREAGRGERADEKILAGLAQALSAHLERAASAEASPLPEATRDERLKRAIEYIANNATRDVPLTEAAEVAGLSPCHFSRLLSRAVGSNYRTFLNSVRIEEAERLVRDTDLPFTEVAYESGFESVRAFNRAFRKLTGRTPSLARKNP